MECPINGIIIPPNRRPLRNLEELAESIEQVGLLHPIIINENNRLLAGYHRLEACRSLGWADIPVHILRVDDIEEQLVEIDENLIRNELTILDRAEQLKRRKELYEELHPETRRGVAGGKASGASRRGEKRTSADNAFVQDTAEKTGRARRTIAEDVQIASHLSAHAKETLRETTLADSKKDLLKLARMAPEEQKEIVDCIQEGAADVFAAVRKIRLERQIKKIESSPLVEGEFNVVVVDPPWPYEARKNDRTHRVANPYPSMEMEELMRLGIPAAVDCTLWLWTTNAFLHQAFHLLEAWGFDYKTTLTWAKNKLGMGDWLRGKTEHCLMAIKGQPAVQLTHQSTLTEGKVRQHSRKPEEFFKMVEALCPGRKAEMFSRQQRQGWECFGAEYTLFDEKG